MLIENVAGHYRHLKGIAPYSCGVVAEPGWEIVHVIRSSWSPWREGFDYIDDYLRDAGLLRSALCAVELRSPLPLTMDDFIEFNRDYCAVLEQWQLLLEGLNPIARTNVVPSDLGMAVPTLHAFSYVRPNPKLKRTTFVVAGAGELREGTLDPRVIIRRGETSAAAMNAKVAYVLDVMTERLRGLGVGWDQASAVDVYTVQPIARSVRGRILKRIGPAARYGFCWHVAQPPVVDLEFEMDVRGVATELHV